MKKIVYLFSFFIFFIVTASVHADYITVSNVAFNPTTSTFSFDYVSTPPINSANIYKVQINTPDGFYYMGNFTCSSTHCDMSNPLFPDFQWYFASSLYASKTNIQTSIYPSPVSQFYSQFFTMASIFPMGTYPTTTATLSPSPNPQGEYSDPVSVSLSSTASASIAHTYYTVDGGTTQTYSAPFTVSGVGNHEITYFSVDTNDSQETANSETFSIISDPTITPTPTPTSTPTPTPTSTPTPTATPTPTYTLGFTSQGTTLSQGSHDYMNGSKYATGANGGTTDSISVYAGNIGNSTHRSYQLAIYTTKTNGKPGVLVAQTSTGTLTANSWNTLPISATLAANTTYWLMYNNNGQNDSVNNIYYSTGTSNMGAYAERTFGTWPTNYPNPDMGNWKYSIYVTYH